MGVSPELCKHFIEGDWSVPSATEFLAVTNSSTGEVIARTPLAAAEDADLAVKAAAKAFPAWAETPVSKRVQVLYRYKALFEQQLDDLARLLTLEHGKTLDESRGELRRGLEVVELACGMPMLMKGEALDDLGGGVDYHTVKYPLGVCAGITPFNFPGMISHWMFPVAVACGNTFVLKPSPQTPLTSNRCAELLHDAGIPNGVFNVVHGGKECVDALLVHPRVKAVSFVGSTPVADYIHKTAAAHGKRVQAAGGAKNHLVVMPDAPWDLVVPNIISSAFGCAGERCMAVANVVAVGKAADQLLGPLTKAASALRVGRTDTGGAVDMGPLVSADHLKRVRDYVELGAKEGASVVLDGRDLHVADAPNGHFIGPTIFDHVDPSWRIAREEIFGPVLCIIRVDSLDEAIDLINGTSFGNAACIYTQSGPAARMFRVRVNHGMIGVNVGVPAPVAFFPFSGWNTSFFGDLHVQGREGVSFYTHEKVTLSRWEAVGEADTFNRKH